MKNQYYTERRRKVIGGVVGLVSLVVSAWVMMEIVAKGALGWSQPWACLLAVPLLIFAVPIGWYLVTLALPSVYEWITRK
jgi:hypothetical protein